MKNFSVDYSRARAFERRPSRSARAIAAMSGDGGRSSSSVGTRDRDEVDARARAARDVVERREQIDRLARAEQFDRDHVARAARRARAAFSAARHAHADVVFLVRRRRNRVDAGRVRERLELGGERRRGDLRHHQARLQPAVAREERRQAAQRRIDEPIGPPLADRRQRRERRWPAGRRRARPARRESCRPRRCRRVSAKTIGLSVAALASIVDRLADERAARRAPRRAPGRRSASSRRPAPCRSSRATR